MGIVGLSRRGSVKGADVASRAFAGKPELDLQCYID
jgi:hypothetical protein